MTGLREWFRENVNKGRDEKDHINPVLISLWIDEEKDEEFIKTIGFDAGYSYFVSEGFTQMSTPREWPSKI